MASHDETIHPLQQCLRDNGEQIAEKVTELQFKEVLAVNAELRAEVEKLKQDSRNYLHEVEQLKAQRDELAKLLSEITGDHECCTKYYGDEYEIGERACCGVLSYEDHKGHCSVVKAKAALSRIEVK